MKKTIEFTIPDGYIKDETASDNTKVVFKLKDVKITDRVKTFNDALSCLPDEDKDLLIYRTMNNAGITGYALATQKLVIIVKALNEGWKPDWNNSNEYKYWPYFDMRSASGFGFSHSLYAYWNTNTNVGSRLCLKSSELAKYAATQFIEIYKESLI